MEKKGGEKLKDKYILEIKVYNELGVEVASLDNRLSDDEEEKIKRTIPLNINNKDSSITIVPKVTKKALFSESKVVAEGKNVEVNLKKLELDSNVTK